MKFKLPFLLLFSSQFLFAQTFSELQQTPPFESVASGSIAFADVNGDNNQDVLITGSNSSGNKVSKLYINDGMGNFSEMPDTPFDGVTFSSVAFADVDGDTDQDVLIVGDDGVAYISKLYTNDGAGNFTESTGASFEGARDGSVAIEDVNSDDYPDVLITGNNGANRISKLYTNDGAGNFTEVINISIEGVDKSSIAFADVNSDDHPDVLVTGRNNSNDYISKLYINDGMGNYSEMTNTPIEGVFTSSIAFSDVNNDGLPDVLITGRKNNLERITILYTNDGAGNFTEMTGTPFEGVSGGSIAFADVNGDSIPDVLITGGTNGGIKISKLYTNDGAGNFMELTNIPFDAVSSSSVAFANVNNDSYVDVLITGNNGSEFISKLYVNDGVTSSANDLNNPFVLDLMAYPSPAESNNIYINHESIKTGFITVNVYNSNGYLLSQQVEFAAIGRQTFSIDISTFSPGSYLIQLDDGKRKGVAKFMVQ